MMRWRPLPAPALIGAILLSGCVSANDGAVTERGIAPPPVAPTRSARPQPLLGWDARRLVERFGQPRLDIRDPMVRKMQFMTGGCVLDAYLYVTERGKEPVVTWMDTRDAGGRDVVPSVCGIV